MGLGGDDSWSPSGGFAVWGGPELDGVLCWTLSWTWTRHGRTRASKPVSEDLPCPPHTVHSKYLVTPKKYAFDMVLGVVDGGNDWDCAVTAAHQAWRGV